MTKAQLIDEVARLRRRLLELECYGAEMHQLAQALQESEARYRTLLDESSDPIFTFYPDGTYRYVNQAFAEGVGVKREDILGRKIWDIFPKEEADKRYSVLKWVIDHAETKVFEVRVPRADGDRYYITTVKPLLDDKGWVKSVICISKEITERKAVEKELLHLSTHDILTGLYNRNYFEMELARLQHSRLFPVSLVVADLDGLKAVNDREGHTSGDNLLRKVAEALHQSFREEDIIARIGGDEFAILLPETNPQAAQGIVERLSAQISGNMGGLFSLSIGLASCEQGGDLLEALRLADDRMYREKELHKRGIQ
jgi:diguanylate cyclase (GGDEF)-like protein/PAS domain S-box-containing protein